MYFPLVSCGDAFASFKTHYGAARPDSFGKVS